jgi:hypothetical protein
MRLPEFVAISAPLIVSWTLQLGSVYALLLALPRLMEPSEYAAATAALSVYLVITAPCVALQASDSAFPLVAFGTLLRWVVVAGLATLVAVPGIGAVFHLPVAPLTLLVVALPASVLASARMQELRRSGARSVPIGQAAGAAVRVAASITLVLAGWGLAGILAGVAFADVLTLALVSLGSRQRSGDRARRPSPSVGSPLGPTIFAVTSVVLLIQLDLLMAVHRLPGREAGAYAAAGMLTRALVLTPAIGAAAVMRGRSAIGGADPFQWLHRSLAATIAALVALWLALAFFGDPVAAVILGPKLEGASSLIPVLAAVAGSLAVIWQLSYFHLVAASRSHLLLLGIASVEVAALAVVTASPDVIAWTALVGAAAGAFLQYVGARAISRWSPPLSELRPHEEIASATRLPGEEVELSMILPCYNAGPGLRVFLERLTAELERGGSYEIIVVSDGSTDGTVEIAQRFPSPCVRVIHYPDRAGKGHALRVGLNAARGAFVGFIDADGDIDPRAIGPFLSLMNLYEPDVVLGSKRHPMSQVSYPALRRVMSWTYHKLARVLFRINVRDTQTGLKLVRRDVLARVLPRMFEKRYAFDLELLVVARMLGFTNVFEAPVRIDYRFSSNVNPDAVVGILRDTAAIFYRRYILDTYRHAGDRLLIVRPSLQDD